MGWLRPPFPDTAGYINLLRWLTAVYAGLLYIGFEKKSRLVAG